MITREQRNLYNQMNQKQVSYFRVHADIMGSLAGGIYLSQLLFWMTDEDGNKKERFLKTDKQIMGHTGISYEQVKGAKRRLKEKGFATIEKTGSPPKTVYLLNHEKILEEIMLFVNQRENPIGENTPLGNPIGENTPFEWGKKHHSLKDKEIVQEIKQKPSCILPKGEGDKGNETPNSGHPITDVSECPVSHSEVSPVTTPTSDQVQAPAPKARTKGTRAKQPTIPLPTDWEITEEMVAWAKVKCPLVNLTIQNEMFIVYFRADPGEKAEKRPGWLKSWQGWMLREEARCQERGETVQTSTTQPKECNHRGAFPLPPDGAKYRCDKCHTDITDLEYRRARGDMV